MRWALHRVLERLLMLAAKTKPNQVLEGATLSATRCSKAASCHGGTSRLTLLSLFFPGKKLKHRAAGAGHQRLASQHRVCASSECVSLEQL